MSKDYSIKIETIKQYELWAKKIVESKDLDKDMKDLLYEVIVSSFKDGLKFMHGKLEVTVYERR